MSGHSDEVAGLGVEQALKCSSLLVLLGFDENLGNPGMNSTGSEPRGTCYSDKSSLVLRGEVCILSRRAHTDNELSQDEQDRGAPCSDLCNCAPTVSQDVFWVTGKCHTSDLI